LKIRGGNKIYDEGHVEEGRGFEDVGDSKRTRWMVFLWKNLCHNLKKGEIIRMEGLSKK